MSGISKTETIERAKNAPDIVGLQNQYNKHNQLSGGQCQKVSISLALIINLEIIFGYNIYHLLF
jgi:ABC-type methionine transport system ATPase subunit